MDFKIISISTLLTIVIILATASLGATANISNNDEITGYGYENPDDNDDDDNSYWSYWNKRYNTTNNTENNTTNQTIYGNYTKVLNDTQIDALYNNGDGVTFTPKNATYLPKEPPYNLITLAKVLSSFAAIFIIYKIITIFFIKKTPTYNTHTYPEKETEIDDFSDDNDGNKNL